MSSSRTQSVTVTAHTWSRLFYHLQFLAPLSLHMPFLLSKIFFLAFFMEGELLGREAKREEGVRDRVKRIREWKEQQEGERNLGPRGLGWKRTCPSFL